MNNERLIIYQVLPRLYGNAGGKNLCGGSIEENGCGKFSAFTSARLQRLRATGYTHVWYTGVLRHATQTAYDALGLQADPAQIVKGRAGSPYAVRDYYDVCPDLADVPAERMSEFDALVARTHAAGLRFVMDFVPNHVARTYQGEARPAGTPDLGADDDTAMGFSPRNNFYYTPGEPLHLDNVLQGSEPQTYVEEPARATGNDVFHAWPGRNDWYETIKLNYGIDYQGGRAEHFDPVPPTWERMTEILLFWASRGVDGFRCDMAEMVPAAFWHYAIARVKAVFPHLIFIAEVYNPAEYRTYIYYGGFDYLYDKVGLYDTLRAVVRGERSAADITQCWQAVDDIRPHMLNFLENHDEQRIASPFFAGDARRALPALVVSACFGTSPFMVYAGQEIGERGMDHEGFSGEDGRTTIFDYWCVGALKKLLKGRQALTKEEKALADYYARVLQLQNECGALREGSFYDLQYANAEAHDGFRPWHHYAFLRQQGKEAVLVCANFSDEAGEVGICIPQHAFDFLKLREGRHRATDLLTGECFALELSPDSPCRLSLPAHGAVVVRL